MSFQAPSPDGRRDGESGSAYIIALLLLVVFTVLGLGLTLITQTEMQLGANEKTLQRSFYAADSGLALSEANALSRASFEGRLYDMEDLGMPVTSLTRHEVETSPFFPIETSPCNLCDINNQGSYDDQSFWRINYAASARARRFIGSGTEARSEKNLATMVSVQPWRQSTDALAAGQEPGALDLLKF